MEKQAARQQIKQHLKAKGQESIEVSSKIVRYWWNIANYAIFDGVVVQPNKISIIKHEGQFAWTIPDIEGGFNISMYPTFVSRTLFLTILIHEMVHAWEYMYHDDMGHGKRFLSWRHRIRRATTLGLQETMCEEWYKNRSLNN